MRIKKKKTRYFSMQNCSDTKTWREETATVEIFVSDEKRWTGEEEEEKEGRPPGGQVGALQNSPSHPDPLPASARRPRHRASVHVLAFVSAAQQRSHRCDGAT